MRHLQTVLTTVIRLASAGALLTGFVVLGSDGPFSVEINGRDYFRVDASNPGMDSGAEVCASLGGAPVSPSHTLRAVL